MNFYSHRRCESNEERLQPGQIRLNTDRDGKLLDGGKGSITVLVTVKEQGKWWVVARQNTELRGLPESFKAPGKLPGSYELGCPVPLIGS